MEGTGFYRRNRNDQDVDDDIDIDGEDTVLFGAAQFTEQDVLAPSGCSDATSDAGIDEVASSSSGTSVGIHGKDRQTAADRTTLEATRADGTEKLDLAVELARRTGDQIALIRALESKVRLLVRSL